MFIGFMVVNLFWGYHYVTWRRKHFRKHRVALCVVTIEKALLSVIYGTCVIVLSWASGPLGFIITVFINQIILSKHYRISFFTYVYVCVFLRWIQCQSCLISHWTTATRSQKKVCITYLVLTMSWLYLESGVALILPNVSTLRYCIALRMRTWMCTLSGLVMMIRILRVPSVNVLILSNRMSHTWISCCTFSMQLSYTCKFIPN
jgi:hypothetical protein